MTRLTSLLDTIGWTTEEAAARLDINPRTLRRWKNGQNATPAVVLVWLGHIAGAIEAAPFSFTWPMPEENDGEATMDRLLQYSRRD